MRKHKYSMMKSVVAATLLTACSTAFAQNWDNGGVGDSWMNPTNWSGDTLPTSADTTTLDNSDTVVLYAGDAGETGNFYPKGSGGGTVDLTVQGTLTTTGIGMPQPTTGSSIVTIDGGTWTVTGYSYWNSAATLVVTNGGTFNVNNTGYGYVAGGLKLYDGTVNVGKLRMAAGGLIEMGNNGTLVVDGNEAAAINGFVDAGLIVAMDPLKTISVDYVNGDTIVQAVVPPTLEELVEQVHAASMRQRTNVLSNAVGVETLWPGPSTNAETQAWGDNMWALSLLALNERVDDANARLQTHAADALSTTNLAEAVAYFGFVDYVKILALFNSQSPHYPGRLEPATESAMKEILWLWAKDFEEYWEPSRNENRARGLGVVGLCFRKP